MKTILYDLFIAALIVLMPFYVSWAFYFLTGNYMEF